QNLLRFMIRVIFEDSSFTCARSVYEGDDLMARWWALWLAWGGALSAQASEGIAYDLDPALTCPSPTQLRSALEAQVEPATSPGDSDWLGRRMLRVEAGPLHTLVVELF